MKTFVHQQVTAIVRRGRVTAWCPEQRWYCSARSCPRAVLTAPWLAQWRDRIELPPARQHPTGAMLAVRKEKAGDALTINPVMKTMVPTTANTM